MDGKASLAHDVPDQTPETQFYDQVTSGSVLVTKEDHVSALLTNIRRHH